jgi:hypothetical protein
MGTNLQAGNRRWQRPGQPRAAPTACPSLPGCRVQAWSAAWAIEKSNSAGSREKEARSLSLFSPDLDALGSFRPRERIRRRGVRPLRTRLRRRSSRQRRSGAASCSRQLLRIPRRSRERLLLCVDSERFKLLLRERVDKLVHGGPSTVRTRLGRIDLGRLRCRPWWLRLRLLLLLGVRRRSFGTAGDGVPLCGADWHRCFTRHSAALSRQNSPARSRAEARNAKRVKRTERRGRETEKNGGSRLSSF